MPLHYVRRLTVVSLLVCTNTYGSDMYYNTQDSSKCLFSPIYPILSNILQHVLLYVLITTYTILHTFNDGQFYHGSKKEMRVKSNRKSYELTSVLSWSMPAVEHGKA